MLNRGALNPQQCDAVETISGPLLVLAGAGSGKTRVVTTRIVNLIEHGIDPSAILGLTFTNKAAGEMKQRIVSMTRHHVLICTFHSLGVRIMREFAHLLGFRRDFTIYDDQDVEKIMKLCLEELPEKPKFDAKDFLQIISQAKNAMQGPDDVDDTGPASMGGFFSRVYRAYRNKLLECNALDFDDLLFLPVKLFRDHPEVLDYYQTRWSHYLVDEFQDTNGAQYEMIHRLASKHQNICVVGDPDQSIYSWRGANVNNILGFEQNYPGAKVITLNQNYRSRTNILNAANALIRVNTGRYEKELWSDKGPGDTIKRFTADSDRGEADFVAEKIAYHYEHHNISLKEMAVFYRTNAQSRALEDRLLMRHIPYVIVGGVSFYQRREIKDILAFLRSVQSGSDYVSFLRTINLPKRGLGETTIEKIRLSAGLESKSILSYCEDLVSGVPLEHPVRLSAKQREGLKSYVDIILALRKINQESSLKELVKAAIQLTGYLVHLELEPESMQERKENLNALIAKASEWENCTEEPSLEGFLEELSLKSSLDEAAGGDERVSLMTIHNGKGLEFEVVFLVGLEEDLFPHANSRDSEPAQEEERRLCYVGMTRAKEYLYLCDVRQRLLWGTIRQQRPSRFFNEIPSKYVEKIRPSFYAKPQAAPPRSISYAEPEDKGEPFSDELGDFAVGDTVAHPSFGIGVIQQVYTGSAGLTYKIRFSKDDRERSLVASMVQLKKL